MQNAHCLGRAGYLSTGSDVFSDTSSAYLASSVETYSPYAPCAGTFRRCLQQQKSSPFDGVLEHNFVISQHLDDAHRLKRDSFACWVDISNAFGSVPHSILWNTLHSMGADPDFIRLVKDIYLDSSSAILTKDGKTAQVPILKGIKQGCPLSGILFDIAIDHILKIIQ
ncbi:retrovirus-related Pol polyprotein from type-2 retrotransposable element R2DM, partial [Nephila pilipes]